MRNIIIVCVLILAVFLCHYEALAFKIEDGYEDGSTRQPGRGPAKPNIGKAGPKPKKSYDTKAGMKEPKLYSYGSEPANLTLTQREYKVPTYIGRVMEMTGDYILITNKTDNIPRYHTFIVNPRTAVRGEVKKGVTVKVTYQIGKEREVNRVKTTMTAVTINVMPAGTEEERIEDEYEESFIDRVDSD